MILSIPNNLAGVGADIIKKKKNGYKSGVSGNWAMLRSKGIWDIWMQIILKI